MNPSPQLRFTAIIFRQLPGQPLSLHPSSLESIGHPKMKMSLKATSMAALVVVAAFLCCPGMVAPVEGRALLNIDKLIDHLKGHCPPPASDPVPEPYTPSQPEPYYPPLVVDPAPSPPYGSSSSPVDPSPPVYQTPPAGGY